MVREKVMKAPIFASRLAMAALDKGHRVIIYDPNIADWPDGCEVYGDAKDFSMASSRASDAVTIDVSTE